MKKIIQGLLGALLLVSSAGAADKANRTFLTARDSISNNAAMNASVPAMEMKNKKGMIGADVAVTGYYRRSHNNSEMAKYFGAGQGTAGSPIVGDIKVAADTQGGTVTGNHVYGLALEHTPSVGKGSAGVADTNHPMGGTIQFSPVREEFGANVAWNQCLGRVMSGLSLNVSAPIVGVRSNMNMKIVDSVPSQASAADGGTSKDLKDLFSGLSLGKKSVNAGQSALTHGKVAWNKIQGDTKFAIGDVSVGLGWAFLKEADYSVSASLNAVVPTGNTATGEFLFEPIAGNHKHFGLGAGVNANFNLWRSVDKKDCLDFNTGVNYSYLFSGAERRIQGVWNHVDSKFVDAGHYRLTVRPSATAAIPAANELVTDVNVTPGSQVDATAGVCYRWNQWNFDASYNLHYRDAETVKPKNATGWQNDKVGYSAYAAKTAPTVVVVGKDNADLWSADTHTIGGPIQRDGVTSGLMSTGAALTGDNTARYHVTTKACATPSQLTHKAGASFGYNFNTAKPVRLGMGAEYEVGSNNDSSVSYAVWAKIGFCF